jgi:hypothetical protein
LCWRHDVDARIKSGQDAKRVGANIGGNYGAMSIMGVWQSPSQAVSISAI